MDAWTFIWLMLILKIPIVALFLLVRWAVRQAPEPDLADGGQGGIGPRPRSPHNHPRSRLPRLPRRGPHGGSQAPPPARVRTAVARARLSHR